MSRVIVLDSGPLGLLLFPSGHPSGDACRNWVASRLTAGDRIIVPEIIDYEIRRELIRAKMAHALANLDAFNGAQPDRYLPLTTAHLHAAAQFWADLRNQGTPTADRHALDIDVILAAQARSLGLPSSDYVVATGNLGHLSLLVPAELWDRI